MITPKESPSVLAQWGTEHLSAVIAIDSQSDEQSQTIPSTSGQRDLSDHLRGFFESLGYAGTQDDYANLIVTVPANTEGAPSVAFMVHMDTSEGTQAVEALELVEAWDGETIAYPENDRLSVSADNYAATCDFVGDDVLHGPGLAPIGLDDKLGMSELMTLARVLKANPEIPHGEILMIFRPDEEIGRMAAVVGLADVLHERGVRYGYTVDGIAPFEVNAENFNAARARVTLRGLPLNLADVPTRRIALRIDGVKSHGATAKAEGYRNATLIFARAMRAVPHNAHPVAFETDSTAETSADVAFILTGDVDAAEFELLAALEAEITPHSWRGAGLEVLSRTDRVGADELDGLRHVARHLQVFLETPGVAPLLSEDSEGREGYSNPYALRRDGDNWIVDYRLRDFDPEGLDARAEHVRLCARLSELTDGDVDVEQQYINMGPELAKYPELVTWAVEALEPLGAHARTYPIRGGTGVDPFLKRGIPVANLGTGYFAPESEKELTSRQNIARHSLWLTHLVQVIARQA